MENENTRQIDETAELDPAKDYPFRPSLITNALCGMCKQFSGFFAQDPCHCTKGHEIVYPVLATRHHCDGYVYKPHVIKLPPSGKIVAFVGLIDARPECSKCSHNMYGYCSGIGWYPFKIKGGTCEFWRDSGLMCKHAIPHMAYGETIMNHYCSLPPEQRDEDAEPYYIPFPFPWDMQCHGADYESVERLRCYEPRDPALMPGVQERREKRKSDTRRVEDTRCHVRVGDFYLSPLGPSKGYYVDLNGWLLHLDRCAVTAIIEAMGLKADRAGSSSWEHDSWRMEGENLVFDVTIGSCTRHPVRFTKSFPVQVARETLLGNARCPHLSKLDLVHLKDCEWCPYAERWGSYDCLYSYPAMDPVRKLMDNPRSFMFVSRRGDAAELKLKILGPHEWTPPKWRQVYEGLRARRSEIKDETLVGILVRHYSSHNAIEHKVVFDKPATACIHADGMAHAIQAFAEACWFARGAIEPLPADKHPLFEDDDFDDEDFEEEGLDEEDEA